MIFVILGLISLSGSVYGQKTAGATKFSSVYTNTGADCKTISGGEGTDDASDCRGAGGYRLHIWASAANLWIGVETPDKKDRITIATQGFDFDRKPHVVEWRTANGKPFAVILRLAKYDESNEQDPYGGKKIGEELTVSGLKGYEDIEFTIDAKTPNANLKAREMADEAYRQKQKN